MSAGPDDAPDRSNRPKAGPAKLGYALQLGNSFYRISVVLFIGTVTVLSILSDFGFLCSRFVPARSLNSTDRIVDIVCRATGDSVHWL